MDEKTNDFAIDKLINCDIMRWYIKSRGGV